MFPSLYTDVSDVVQEFRRIVMMPAACLKVKRSIRAFDIIAENQAIRERALSYGLAEHE